MSAGEAIMAVTGNRTNIEYRQLTALDQFGNSASFSGKNILGTYAVSERRNCVAADNRVKLATLPKVMTGSFVTKSRSAS